MTRLDAPPAALAWHVGLTLNLDETLVETEIVSNGVLPTAVATLEVGMNAADPQVDFRQTQALI